MGLGCLFLELEPGNSEVLLLTTQRAGPLPLTLAGPVGHVLRQLAWSHAKSEDFLKC